MTLKLSVKLAQLVATKIPPKQSAVKQLQSRIKRTSIFPFSCFPQFPDICVWCDVVDFPPPGWCEKWRVQWGDPPKPGGQWHPGGHWSVPRYGHNQFSQSQSRRLWKKLPFASSYFCSCWIFCFQRKSGSFLQLLVGNNTFLTTKTTYFGETSYENVYYLVGRRSLYSPYTFTFSLGGLELNINTWRSKKTQQNKQNFWHSTLFSK